jgi:hypothetical protein
MSQLTTPSDPDTPPPPDDPGIPPPTPDVEAGADTPVVAPTPGEPVDQPSNGPNPGGELAADSGEGALPSGLEGAAVSDVNNPAPSGPRAEIIIGEIPDAKDLSVMRWTARCTSDEHDLLGHYDTREEAEQAGAEHMASLHTK